MGPRGPGFPARDREFWEGSAANGKREQTDRLVLIRGSAGDSEGENVWKTGGVGEVEGYKTRGEMHRSGE